MGPIGQLRQDEGTGHRHGGHPSQQVDGLLERLYLTKTGGALRQMASDGALLRSCQPSINVLVQDL